MANVTDFVITEGRSVKIPGQPEIYRPGDESKLSKALQKLKADQRKQNLKAWAESGHVMDRAEYAKPDEADEAGSSDLVEEV